MFGGEFYEAWARDAMNRSTTTSEGILDLPYILIQEGGRVISTTDCLEFCSYGFRATLVQ